MIQASQSSVISKIFGSLVILMALLLSGCNGHKEDSDNTTIGENAEIGLAISNVNGQHTGSFTIGNQVHVVATVASNGGTPIPNQAVSFTTTGGNLTVSSRLTDSSGQASVVLDTNNATAGLLTITASTTVDSEPLSIDVTIEVLSATSVDQSEPSVLVSLSRAGEAVNRIRAGESAQLGVTLVDQDEAPIENAIVSFSAELGTLSATSALTNASGIAEVTLTAQEAQLGAAVATASFTTNNQTFSDNIAYEVVSADAVDDSSAILIGYFDDSGEFVEGEIQSDLADASGDTTISAGATLGLSVVVVDQDLQRITTPTTVNFSSSCTVAEKATLDETVTTVNGEARTTYQDLSCAGAQGNDDTIVATVRVNSADLIATHDVTLQAENLGSVEFLSASPESIVLKGTGGQGKQETSTLTFVVKGELGNPLNQQDVTFALNTTVGGLTLAADSGVTNSEGLVSAKVIAGTVPAAVRVTASVTNGSQTISTQSDLLSVNTGLPDQNSLTIALSTINPEARQITGTQVTVTAYLADSFNNPVPDGTTVNFTTEGGAIEPSCTTTQGNCSVIWTSQEPYADNHRVTILATAEGHEYFVDTNGNNVFDNADGDPQNASIANIDEILSGFGRISSLSSGFIDMPEAWRDDNENDQYDAGELFIDANNDGSRTAEDGLFNGPQCQGDNCSGSKFVTIRKAAVLITSSSGALYRLIDNSDGSVIASNYDNSATYASVSIQRQTARSFTLEMSDTQFQTLARNTNISIDSSVGELIGGGTVRIANTVGSSDPATPGTVSITFSITNNLAADDEGVIGGLNFSATSPSSIETKGSAVIILE